jgi:hypothetical protein
MAILRTAKAANETMAAVHCWVTAANEGGGPRDTQLHRGEMKAGRERTGGRDPYRYCRVRINFGSRG